MNIEELNTKLQKFDDYFRTHGEALTEKERLFSRVVKLNEEVGELCEAVLCEFDSNQRKKEREIDMDAELADVLICTLLLARNREKNIWDEVEKKVEKQLQRFNLN
ncbi:MAG: MazG-like family protein [Candidatus Pacebacteria bacterium]|jgi:NTP pyrophosphatase (non-canonical NTP hydrolase)|nr:MazG-like family protein [Candidatus Paceibacterota bacterium]